jgi:hypothetical protein
MELSITPHDCSQGTKTLTCMSIFEDVIGYIRRQDTKAVLQAHGRASFLSSFEHFLLKEHNISIM